jgi:hypothetical protein
MKTSILKNATKYYLLLIAAGISFYTAKAYKKPPTKITEFSVASSKKSVTLKWNAAEENLNYYIVQRSADGKNFSDVAIVFTVAAGQPTFYAYKDPGVCGSGFFYYRLAMVGKNNEIIYSAVQKVQPEKADEASRHRKSFSDQAGDRSKIKLPFTSQGSFC